MREAKILTIVFLCAVLLAAWGRGTPTVRAQDEQEKKVKVTVSFKSIEADFRDTGDPEKNKVVNYVGDFDEQLKKALKDLIEKNGYNYFRIVKSDVLTVSNKEQSDYRLVNDRDYYAKSIVKNISVWTDDDKKEHKYVEMTSTIVQRTVEKDDQGKEKVVEKVVAAFDFGREVGNYFTLAWLKFFKKKDGDKEKTSDLILAISPRGEVK